MSILKQKRAYLSGPIEYSQDINWRTKPKQVLVEEFGIDLFDPFCDPKQQWTEELNEARKNQDFETVTKICKLFVRKDLCWVDRSDFIISFLPYKVPTTGTVHEIINSNNAKKPTLLVTDAENVSYIPLWYFGFIPVEFMFAGWESLFSYLREVNSGLHKHNNRWSFIYGEI
jgi:hypothetical protein